MGSADGAPGGRVPGGADRQAYQTAEDARDSAYETAEANRDSEYDTAEAARQQAYATAEAAREAESDAATTAANNAAAAANQAAENVQDALEGDLDPLFGDWIDAQKDVAGGLVSYDTYEEQMVVADGTTLEKVGTTIKVKDAGISTQQIADASVTTAKLADDSVTAEKLVDGSVGTNALASSSITTEKYADGSLTYAKLADDVTEAITQPQMGKDLGAYTWQELMQLVADPANAADDFAYMVGQTKPLQIAGYGNFIFRMIGVGQDVRSDNGQPAKMTFEIVDISTIHRMNPSNSTTGGWGDSEMREWLNSTMLNALPDYMIDGITTVKKEYKNGEGGSIMTCDDKLWCLSDKELTNGTTYGDEGEFYEYWASHNRSEDRIKRYNGSTNRWWLRSVNSSTNFRDVGSDGVLSNTGASAGRGVVFCFCIG